MSIGFIIKNDFSFEKNYFLWTMFDCAGFLKRNGWIQAELAKKLGCSKSTVAMWSAGANSPPYSVIEKLIELGATLEELFGKEHAEMLARNSSCVSSGTSRIELTDEDLSRAFLRAAELLGQKGK